jgi:hypothetical protein
VRCWRYWRTWPRLAARFGFAGGWGVDALVGRQTRSHRDLDLALDAGNEAAALRALQRRGYRVETDWRPVRIELVAEGRGWVDVHPVVFDATGHGRQADIGGVISTIRQRRSTRAHLAVSSCRACPAISSCSSIPATNHAGSTSLILPCSSAFHRAVETRDPGVL